MEKYRERIFEYIDGQKDDIINSLTQLIRIPSVKSPPIKNAPFGKDCAEALKYMLEKSESLGFKTKNFSNYIGQVEVGSGKECFGILTHLDVVPVTDKWTYPPFSGKIVDNEIYGRGATDNKGPSIAALFALKAVCSLNKGFARRARLIFGCDEESGWEDINHYKQHEKMPDMAISPDGEYPVINSEKGILHVIISWKTERNETERCEDSETPKLVSIKGGSRANVVPGEATAVIRGANESAVRELAQDIGKKYGVSTEIITNYNKHNEIEIKHDETDIKHGEIDVKHSETEIKHGETDIEHGEIEIRVSGSPAHAMNPAKGKNAICALLEIVDNICLGGKSAKLETLDNTAQHNNAAQLDNTAQLDNAVQLDNSAHCEQSVKAAITKLRRSFPFEDYYGEAAGIACSDAISGKLTANLGLIEYSKGGDILTAVVDIRYPVSCNPSMLTRLLKSSVGLDADVLHEHAPHFVDPNSELVKSLLKIYERETGFKGECLSIGGGTYARAMENAVTFGCKFPGKPELAHEDNERIDIDELILNTKILACVIAEMCLEA